MNNLIKILKKYKYYFLAFLLLGLFVYFPVFSNGFAWDDFDLIIENSQLHQLNLTIFFDNYFNTGSVYRQVTVFYHALLYSLFRENPFPYHLLQIVLHVICTSLIFLLFTKYFKVWLSFLLSLIFLIHPVNVESVAWISGVACQLFTIPGLLALLLTHKKILSQKDIILLGIYLALSLLAYEFGILFIVLAVFNLYLRKSPQFKNTLILSMTIVSSYVFLRLIANAFGTFEKLIPFAPTSLSGKIIMIPSILAHYAKILFYPTDLMILKYWIITSITLKDVVLPGLGIIVILTLLSMFIFQVERKKRIDALFFFVWFMIGFIPLLHFYPLDMFVSDRWMYFPLIGLLGIIGFVVQRYLNLMIKYKYALWGLTFCIIIFFSYSTFTRIYNWKDTFTLFKHDLQYQPDNVSLNYMLGSKYSYYHQYKEAIPYLEKAISIDPHNYSLLTLAICYDLTGDYEKAIEYYQRTKSFKDDPLPAFAPDIDFSLTRIYLRKQRYNDIVALLTNTVIERSPNSTLLLYARAKANYELKNYDKALPDAEYIAGIANDPKIQELFQQIKAAHNENR